MNKLTVTADNPMPPVYSGPRKIYKYGLDAIDYQEISMPKGAILLDVQCQRDAPQIWAIVNPTEQQMERRAFRTIGTGHPFHYEPTMMYRGSYQLHGGALVFHVFEEYP